MIQVQSSKQLVRMMMIHYQQVVALCNFNVASNWLDGDVM